MPDETPKRPWLDLNPKVLAAAIAAVASAILIPLAKKIGLDLSGQEANIGLIATVVAAYLTPGDGK